MKKISFNLILFLIVCCNVIYANEVEITTEAKEVTVYLNGAQITRTKAVSLNKGIQTLKFINLSPFIDAKSIQVKIPGNITVLAVNHQKNYIKQNEKSTALQKLELQLQKKTDSLKIEETNLAILKEQITFLITNRDVSGKNEPISLTNLQQLEEYYGKQMTKYKMQEIELNNKIQSLKNSMEYVNNQISAEKGKNDFSSGEILVNVDVKSSDAYNIELSYKVNNASWFPSYDIRVNNIEEPLQVIYKANVRQDTKEDWNNVKLKFSTGNPSNSGVAPKLQTHYLNYNTKPPVYNNIKVGNVSGVVFDANTGEALIGVNVIITNTSIGTVTDLDGNYAITLPNDAKHISFSYVGYKDVTVPLNGSVINIALEETAQLMDEVVVTASQFSKVSGIVSTSQKNNEYKKYKIEKPINNNIPIPITQVENQLSIDFEVKTPYTIKSDNKNAVVDMDYYNLPTDYIYYTIPKIDKSVYLLANITNWEKYNFIEGEANVFLEGAFIGKTILDTRYAGDTLALSLGIDKMVTATRDRIKDFTEKKIISTKKEETNAWNITVKNNKSQAINVMLLDQLPISTNEEITLSINNISGAKHNTENGELLWNFKLNPYSKKESILNYTVKYPKNRILYIE